VGLDVGKTVGMLVGAPVEGKPAMIKGLIE